MSFRVYHYPASSTCKKALAFLRERGMSCHTVNIVDSPPTREELLRMEKVVGGETKKLFNSSGERYRQLGLKDKLSGMTRDEKIELLANNGKLIKRPFLVSDTVNLVGFREDEWQVAFKKAR